MVMVTMEMAVAANLASYAHDPSMIKALQERLPQLARRDISEALSHVEQLVEYIPDDALLPSLLPIFLRSPRLAAGHLTRRILQRLVGMRNYFNWSLMHL